MDNNITMSAYCRFLASDQEVTQAIARHSFTVNFRIFLMMIYTKYEVNDSLVLAYRTTFTLARPKTHHFVLIGTFPF